MQKIGAIDKASQFVISTIFPDILDYYLLGLLTLLNL
jgi:hypothetical protein